MYTFTTSLLSTVMGLAASRSVTLIAPVCGAQRHQIPLELDLQVTVTHSTWVLRVELDVLWRIST